MSNTVRSPGSVRTMVLRSYRRSGTSFPFSSGTLIPCGLGLFPRPTQNFASVRNDKVTLSSFKLYVASYGLCIRSHVCKYSLNLITWIYEFLPLILFTDSLEVTSRLRDRLNWWGSHGFPLVSLAVSCGTIWKWRSNRSLQYIAPVSCSVIVYINEEKSIFCVYFAHRLW